VAIQPITGYPSSWRAPFVAAEILLGQGPSSAAAQARAAMYVGPITSAGNWTAGNVYAISNEQDAITGAGVGSPLHRMIRKHLRVNPGGTVYALPHAASSGAGLGTATGTITWATDPTGNGLTTVYVCGEQITQSFTSSDTVTTIAAAVKAKINAKVWLPVTASNASGVLTLTAKIGGASQGDGTIGVIRFRALITPGIGTTIATSGAALGLGTGTAGADGATTENANLSSALANVANSRYYYMGFSAWSATNIATIKTHISTKSQPSPGLRSRAFTGYPSTISNATTLANTPNYERIHISWQKNSEHDTAELAAWLLADTQKEESVDSAFAGFDGYTNAEILPCYSDADRASDADLDTAARNGICAIQSNQTIAFLSMHVTTRSKDSTGAIDDFRATETHRVSVMDDFTDTVLLNWRLTFTSVGFKLQDDARNSDGTLNLNAPIPPKVMTPNNAKSWLAKRIDEFADAAKFQKRDDWKSSIRTNIDPLNSSRLECGASGRTIDIMHQTTFRFSETSPG
jgi:phage tail sheath gpL-like